MIQVINKETHIFIIKKTDQEAMGNDKNDL